MTTADEMHMRAALAEAAAAERAGEVPIGAVVVAGGEIVARAHNQPIALHDPSGHAEILALRAAGAALANYRLVDAELFVTVEPCLMCVGAIIQARLRRVVFGCADPKAGALGGLVDFSTHPGLNHRFSVRGGVCADQAAALLR
ncbi:MAG: tRNA adenosine(34) deaminase TadA, partial [Candidatus Binatia bacterium]